MLPSVRRAQEGRRPFARKKNTTIGCANQRLGDRDRDPSHGHGHGHVKQDHHQRNLRKGLFDSASLSNSFLFERASPNLSKL